MSKVAFVGQRGTGKTTELVKWVADQIVDGKRHIAFIGATLPLFDTIIEPTVCRVLDGWDIKTNFRQKYMKIADSSIRYFAFDASFSHIAGVDFKQFDAIVVDEYPVFSQHPDVPILWSHEIRQHPMLAVSVTLHKDTDLKALVEMLPPDPDSVQFLPVRRG